MDKNFHKHNTRDGVYLSTVAIITITYYYYSV